MKRIAAGVLFAVSVGVGCAQSEGEGERIAVSAGALSAGYLGCFEDAPARALPIFGGSSPDMTPDQCKDRCTKYRYAGVQWHHECWCGDAVGYQRRPEEECSTPCAGDGNQMCGGGWRNSIYALAEAPPPPRPPSCGVFPVNQRFHIGDAVTSCNGRTTFGFSKAWQEGRGYDERLGIPAVHVDGRAAWTSSWSTLPFDAGHELVFQSDGNLVTYLDGRPTWASNTSGNPGARLLVQDDCNVVIYSADGRALLSTGTRCR